MDMLEVVKKNTPPAQGNCIYVVSANARFEAFFNEQECNFIKSSIDDDKQIVHINRFSSQVFVVNVQSKKENWMTKEILRKRGADLFKQACSLKLTDITIADLTDDSDYGLSFLEGFYLSSYQFIAYFKDKDKKQNSLTKLGFYGKLPSSEIKKNINLWESVFQTKTFVNQPVMHLPSHEYIDAIGRISRETGITCTVYNKQWLTEQGMGGILAVNKGSVDEPYLCVLEWKPEGLKNQENPLVLVGKGVMYDSGGLSLKTSAGMETMKSDMSGSAVVCGVMTALAKNNVPKHVVALLPMTDNRPGFNAYAPGDIIKMHNGLFVEVLNTDAEGRMLLADALSFARTFEPSLVIDIATLTGSANAAVGEHAAAVMGTADQSQIEKMIAISMSEHERLVQFPLWDDYNDQIKSDMADLKNVGGPLAGAITAAKFLEHFTAYPWIHIDMAGSAYHPKGGDYRGKGATGFGVRLLYRYIVNK